MVRSIALAVALSRVSADRRTSPVGVFNVTYHVARPGRRNGMLLVPPRNPVILCPLGDVCGTVAN
jgi:hypothetical protein